MGYKMAENKAFESIMNGLSESLAYAKGDTSKARKMSVTELSERVGITMANISILKNGKAKAIKVSTLAKLCEALECQPGDLLEYRE